MARVAGLVASIVTVSAVVDTDCCRNGKMVNIIRGSGFNLVQSNECQTNF